VHERVSGGSARIVGRDSELATVRGFAAADSGVRALVLSGGAGIGKTTLWAAGIELARERGMRVLLARASGAEARLSFAALIDLCDRVDPGALVGVPAPQCAALEVALLRAGPGDVAADPHAMPVARSRAGCASSRRPARHNVREPSSLTPATGTRTGGSRQRPTPPQSSTPTGPEQPPADLAPSASAFPRKRVSAETRSRSQVCPTATARSREHGVRARDLQRARERCVGPGSRVDSGKTGVVGVVGESAGAGKPPYARLGRDLAVWVVE
jgi:hypothetical protein